ncbi:hypothetical protein OF83DRAFT_1177520 [Amylostereum chailletii]|nr:hypothetical protein OF83DRAFT_1177520 [Amylostereum chailletii]
MEAPGLETQTKLEDVIDKAPVQTLNAEPTTTNTASWSDWKTWKACADREEATLQGINARAISDTTHAALKRIHQEFPKGRQNYFMVKYMVEIAESANQRVDEEDNLGYQAPTVNAVTVRLVTYIRS